MAKDSRGTKRWYVWFGIGLLGLSVALYGVHYLVFRDLHHILIYFVGDVAFVPVEVLLVALVIHKMLEGREKRLRMEKMNMLIGVFFGEAGMDLLKRFVGWDGASDPLRKALLVKGDWSGEDFDEAEKKSAGHEPAFHLAEKELVSLRDLLRGKRDVLLRMLENPNLLEHETFSDLLWAVFHLLDELLHRKDLSALPETDIAHLAGDVRRAYLLLLREWLRYMRHLQAEYPYLFSLAVRSNPFDEHAVAEVG